MRVRYVLMALVVAVATGLFCVGVLSRLAMSLLARENPQAHGLISDDGFEMGVVTLAGSVNLAVVGIPLGIVGWLTYLVARPLLVGPAWFQWFSLTVPPGVVAASLVVHPSGVDFTVLEPLWLAVGLFVAVPATYGPIMHAVMLRVGGTPPGMRVAGRAPVVAWALRGLFAAWATLALVSLWRDVLALT